MVTSLKTNKRLALPEKQNKNPEEELKASFYAIKYMMCDRGKETQVFYCI